MGLGRVRSVLLMGTFHMKLLYHWPLDPGSRLVRLMLGEKGQSASLVEASPWEAHSDVQRLAPGATVPALVDQGAEGRVVACGTRAICEHIEETLATPRLLPAKHSDRAEVRRMWAYIEDRFSEINASLLNERASQWMNRDHRPNSNALRTGSHALRGQLTFLNALIEQRGYLACRSLSLADFAASAHLSAYDYFGDVEWNAVPDLKNWYARIKSRPSFRPLLADRLSAVRPVSHYDNLDF